MHVETGAQLAGAPRQVRQRQNDPWQVRRSQGEPERLRSTGADRATVAVDRWRRESVVPLRGSE